MQLNLVEATKRLAESGLYNGSIRTVRATSITYGDYRAYAVETGFDSFYFYYNEKTGEITRTRPKR
jgi:hypothetical protein